MRILIVFGFLLCTLGVQAQNSPDCRTAIPVCADAPIIAYPDGNGDINDFGDDDFRPSGCLEKGSNGSANLENNTSWFVFRAGTGGQLGFNIRALCPDGTDNCSVKLAEFDFALYGPDVDCADITNRTALPIRCNFEVNETEYTGVGVNPENGAVGEPPLIQNMNTYDEWLQVEPGEIYYLLINNYTTYQNGNPIEPFELTFTGSSVEADQDTALDCTLRDEFLGLDIIACEGDPDIPLSALNSPAGPDIVNVTWSVDYDDDGIIDVDDLLSGPDATEYIVTSPNSGRYFVNIETSFGNVTDDILITFYGIPVLDRVEILEDILDDDTRTNNVEIFVDGDSSYEYSVNGSEFQDDPVFNNIPVGINTVVINDKNGCGTTEPIEFLVAGYPKFFTPNNDGVNDEWLVYGIETLTDPAIFIFDRYGKLLKQLAPNSGGWDGTYNGRPMPSSDYWFKLDFSRMEDDVMIARTIQSHFTLKR
ncbi:T9SS type B sorting domain-containing protein [Flavobacteriaceae bacterium TP-CH-4]|uniref:T9SS type B sorting domain-containing protein n=1 Tax=Pelagihabitans pacificus TaxID=2696054 RepID=A0A967APB6_9FLAO|nr:T9SS type B sorting domain-containing protein [Pelagihabitans pacificus]NHF57966.1 T9SS type B sorting domain-containing protein [Pelagihabitans pacificus]